MDAELEAKLAEIVKRQDKILAQQTKIMKALHLLPVTEKEEKAMQIQQRESAGIALKVANDLGEIAGDAKNEQRSLINQLLAEEDPYADVLGSDVMGG